MTDEDIDYSDSPPSTEEELARAKLRMPKPQASTAVQIDPDVLAWFQARGEESHSYINEVLRDYIQAQRH